MTLDSRAILDPAVVDDPYPFCDALRETAPVWKAGPADIYAVTSFDLLAEAARRVEDFSSVMNAYLYRTDDGYLAKLDIDLGSPTLAIADPPVHTLHKQLIFPKFVSTRMTLIEGELTRFAEACIDRAMEMPAFDFMTEIGVAVPTRAIAMLIGFHDRNDALLARTAYELSEITSGARTLAQMEQIQLTHDEIRAWLTDQLNRRAGGGSEHVLDALKAAIASGQLNQVEALTTLLTLLSAGAESTAALLGNAVRMLAEHPEVLRMLRDDPGLLPSFIEEAGRLELPFRYHLRSVPRDTSLGGVDIPAGATVLLMWNAANRDPAKFENPNEINLGRRLQHVTFGRGIHLCVGAALARMEARIVLTALLKRDRFPTLSAGETPKWEYSLMARRHRALPMGWDRGKP